MNTSDRTKGNSLAASTLDNNKKYVHKALVLLKSTNQQYQVFCYSNNEICGELELHRAFERVLAECDVDIKDDMKYIALSLITLLNDNLL